MTESVTPIRVEAASPITIGSAKRTRPGTSRQIAPINPRPCTCLTPRFHIRSVCQPQPRPSPPPHRARKGTEAAERTASRLVAKARQAFATHGFAHVSLDALAAETGVTRGALHHHFQNKAGLFEAVFRAVDADISLELDRIHEAESDPWRGPAACHHAYLDLALRPENARILFRDAPAVMGARAMDILMESGFSVVVEELAVLIAEGRLDLHRFRSGQVLMLSGLLFESHG